ncbi:MAG: hypothetical protein ACI4JC_07055, partial [Faecalibacterium sp.]
RRLSGVTGPVPSATLDKAVFSCTFILASFRQIVKKSPPLFRHSASFDASSVRAEKLFPAQMPKNRHTPQRVPLSKTFFARLSFKKACVSSPLPVRRSAA